MTDNRRYVAVFDVGKTNVKLLLFDRVERREITALNRPNEILPAPPYRHHDAEALEAFLVEGLRELATAWPIGAIVVATHGACAALVDHAGLVTPVLDYDDPAPDELAELYATARPGFAAAGAAQMPGGLNIGAQLFWQKARFPEAFARARHILMWPQYWAWRLTGVAASEITSLACHTDLWDIPGNRLSSLVVDVLDCAEKFPPIRPPFDQLGTLRPELAARTGLAPETPVLCGIHDANASLVPFLMQGGGARTVVSTGTWINVFALETGRTDPVERDGVMVTLDAFGRAVPNYRFPGGRFYDRYNTEVDDGDGLQLLADLRRREIRMVLPDGDDEPTVVGGADDPSAAEKSVLVSAALADRTLQAMGWIGADGPVTVLGPFTRNAVYLAVLRERFGDDLTIETAHAGISEGAAMLAVIDGPPEG